jgi:hypothetical protein
MTDEVWRIRINARRSLKRARSVYADTFGRSINDPGINAELDRLLGEAVGNGDDVVTVPAELVLAILLRAGGRGRGRPRQAAMLRRGNDLAVRTALKLKAEGIAAGLRPGRAAELAAKKAKEQIHCRISVETILDRMDRTGK